MGQRLIVEGENDIRVISQFWMCCNLITLKEYEGLPQKEREHRFHNEFVKIAGSINNIKRDVLPLIAKEADIESVDIIIDADNDPSAKWQSIKQILESKGYTNLPSNLPPEGIVIQQPDLPKIGLWVMPDNTHSGYLEHFYTDLIRTDDNLKVVVDTTIQSLYDQNIVRFSDPRRQKAVAYTWLSWQETPGSSMGLTMKAKPDLFDFEQPTAQAFLAWSKRVFDFIEAT